MIHLAVQVKEQGDARWRYIEGEEANVTIYVNRDLRGKMIYQAWPAYLGVYGKDGKVLYDQEGRAIPGNFKTVERMLPELAKQGYSQIYVMGVYQLDRPENIIGQAGPDASLFSPFEFNISRELGGEAGLRGLISKAKEKYGIEILVDLIPHVNQNFSELPEWAIVKAHAHGRVVRRLATDGSVDHETGNPVEWHDSVLVNWRDQRVLAAYGRLIERLAKMGVKGVRVDIAHNFGTMLPVDHGLKSKQKLFGQVTSWDRQASGGFRVVNDWDRGRANPLLVYLVAETSKRHPEFTFIGENYGQDIQIAKSGVMPMDTGTYADLKKVILEGGSTRDVLNGHFRWMFDSLPKGSQFVGALETHDFYRLMDRWQHYGPYRLKAAIWTWLATTRGPIMLYNRQEIGEVHRIRIDNYTEHNYEEADRLRYYAQLDFERFHGESVEAFYKRVLEFYSQQEGVAKGENYIFDTHHDRIFAIARYVGEQNYIFVVNEWWETAYAELELGDLWSRLKVDAVKEEFYVVKDWESGHEEVYTGEELMAEGIRMRLRSYQAAVLTIRKVKARGTGVSSSPVKGIRERAIEDALRRYSEQYRPRRTEVNYAFRWLEEGVLSEGSQKFKLRFRQMARMVEGEEGAEEMSAADLTVMMHDMVKKHEESRGKIEEMLSSLGESEDEVVQTVSVKVLRWMDVGTVVFVSPEAVPLYKAGGMANVVGELANYLAESGLKMYVITPRYQGVNIGDFEYTGKVANVYMGRHGFVPGVIARKRIKNLNYILLDNATYADKLYGSATKEHESLRAIFLSLGALEAIKMLNIHPTIVAGHDWMTAPLMAHLNSEGSVYKGDPHFADTKTIGWVHNNGQDYQFKVERNQDGVDLLGNLGLPEQDYGWFVDPHRGDLINFMAAFVRHSHLVLAVSPGQLKDYLTTDGKGGAEGFLGIFQQLAHEKRLFALSNGIFLKDRQREWLGGMSRFDVSDEEEIERFSEITKKKQAQSRKIISQKHGEFWPATGGRTDQMGKDHLVVSMVSRITEQKGIQFLAPFIRRVITSGRYPDVSFILAGEGDPTLMGQLNSLVYDFPGRVGYPTAFLSDKDPRGTYYHFYRAGDIFIALSTWEPGGIAPMEALAFGVPALVSDKQGHKSTVKTVYIPAFAQEFGIEADELCFNGARFPMEEDNIDRTVDNIIKAFDELYNIWKARKSNPKWDAIRKYALMSNNSWEHTSQIAEILFKYALERKEEQYTVLAGASMLTDDSSSSPIKRGEISPITFGKEIEAQQQMKSYFEQLVFTGRLSEKEFTEIEKRLETFELRPYLCMIERMTEFMPENQKTFFFGVLSILASGHIPTIVSDFDDTLTPFSYRLGEQIRELLRYTKFYILTGNKKENVDKKALATNTAKEVFYESESLLTNLVLWTKTGTQRWQYSSEKDAYLMTKEILLSDLLGSQAKVERYKAILEWAADLFELKQLNEQLSGATVSDDFVDDRRSQINLQVVEHHLPDDVKNVYKKWEHEGFEQQGVRYRELISTFINWMTGQTIQEDLNDIHLLNILRLILARKFMLLDFELNEPYRIPIYARAGGRTNIDGTLKGMDKGWAVEEIANELGVPVWSIIFLGDSFNKAGNDEPVLKVAGMSINVGDEILPAIDNPYVMTSQDQSSQGLIPYLKLLKVMLHKSRHAALQVQSSPADNVTSTKNQDEKTKLLSLFREAQEAVFLMNYPNLKALLTYVLRRMFPKMQLKESVKINQYNLRGARLGCLVKDYESGNIYLTDKTKSFGLLAQVDMGYLLMLEFAEDDNVAIYAPRQCDCTALSIKARKGNRHVIGHAHIYPFKHTLSSISAEIFIQQFNSIIHFLTQEGDLSDIQIRLGIDESFLKLLERRIFEELVQSAAHKGIDILPTLYHNGDLEFEQQLDVLVAQDQVTYQIGPDVQERLIPQTQDTHGLKLGPDVRMNYKRRERLSHYAIKPWGPSKLLGRDFERISSSPVGALTSQSMKHAKQRYAQMRYYKEPYLATGFQRLEGIFYRIAVYEYLKESGKIHGPPETTLEQVESYIIGLDALPATEFRALQTMLYQRAIVQPGLWNRSRRIILRNILKRFGYAAYLVDWTISHIDVYQKSTTASQGMTSQMQKMRLEYRAALSDYMLAIADWNFRLYILTIKRKRAEDESPYRAELKELTEEIKGMVAFFKEMRLPEDLTGRLAHVEELLAIPNEPAVNMMMTSAMLVVRNMRRGVLRRRLRQEKYTPPQRLRKDKDGMYRLRGQRFERAGKWVRSAVKTYGDLAYRSLWDAFKSGGSYD